MGPTVKTISAEVQGVGATAAAAAAHALRQLFDMVRDGGTFDTIEQVTPCEAHLVQGGGRVISYRVTLGAILNLPSEPEATSD